MRPRLTCLGCLQMSSVLTQDSATCIPHPSPWNHAKLHGVSDALRQHMLPHLTSLELFDLSQTCTAWHDIIGQTKVQQLPATSLEGLLPSGLTSKKCLREALQQQGTVMAKLRGKVPSNSVPQGLSFPGHAVQQIAWCPQQDLDSPSQWILVHQLRPSLIGNSRSDQLMVQVDVVDTIPTQPAHPVQQASRLHPAEPMAAAEQEHAHVHIHSAARGLLRSTESTHAAWTADGRHIAMVSPPAPPLPSASLADHLGVVRFGDERFARTLVVAKVGDTQEVAACRALSLLDHGLGKISPAGSMMLWGELPIGANRRRHNEEVVAYSLPDMQRLYTIGASLVSLGASYSLPEDYMQKSAHEILWAPDGKLFAVHWVFGDAREHVTGHPHHASIMQVTCGSHGFSVHQANSGDCIGSREISGEGQAFSGLFSKSQWDPSSTYLIYRTRHGICSRVETASSTGIAWTSTRHQRNFQWDSPDDFLLEWQGTPDGRYLCVIDFLPGHNQDCSRLTGGQVSILESSRGSIMHQHWLSCQVKDVTWSHQQYVCLLEQHGVVISAGHTTSVTSNLWHAATSKPSHHWRSHVLLEPHGGLCLEGSCAMSPNSGNLRCRLSPCGRIVVSSQQTGDGGTALPLQHWHLGADVTNQHVMQKTANGTAAELLLMHPDLRSLAWHPQQNACIYAVYDVQGGVHIIDAKDSFEVKSWTEAELRGSRPMRTPPKTTQQYESVEKPPPVLEWSPDGNRLAAFSDAACVVVSFMDDS